MSTTCSVKSNLSHAFAILASVGLTAARRTESMSIQPSRWRMDRNTCSVGFLPRDWSSSAYTHEGSLGQMGSWMLFKWSPVVDGIRLRKLSPLPVPLLVPLRVKPRE